ncbi:grasp-with-spasm system SPASM domain peptide maturase [Shewanella sp. 10N.286.45.A1]|uniref:grasp-with-spasm system SPASM domain peptide maturase n=1 Tax=Shewanella sp. 10N.286.45.A1 TaxID=3229694 RepID=UPI0035514B8D
MYFLGVKNSAIYDLSRGNIHTFPSDYFQLLELLDKYSYSELEVLSFDNKCEQDFYDFLSFLESNDMVNELNKDDLLLFPKIDFLRKEDNCLIKNAIIDIKDVKLDFSKIFDELDSVSCEYVQIRQFGNTYSKKDIHEIIQKSYNKSILGVEIILKHDKDTCDSAYRDLLINNPIISALSIHSYPNDKLIYVNGTDEHTDILGKKISFISTSINSSYHCGVINQQTLTPPSTGTMYTLQHFNGCMNKKISIDHNGFIKNCPSFTKNYGHIDKENLINIASNKDFQSLWELNKDNIETCNLCEYRYACSDCRAYTENSKPLTKPEKCQYNPFTGEWIKKSGSS